MSQKEKKKLVSIKTDDTLMETALHGINLFPYKLYDENITDYDFNCIDWHWHTELSFIGIIFIFPVLCSLIVSLFMNFKFAEISF